MKGHTRRMELLPPKVRERAPQGWLGHRHRVAPSGGHDGISAYGPDKQAPEGQGAAIHVTSTEYATLLEAALRAGTGATVEATARVPNVREEINPSF